MMPTRAAGPGAGALWILSIVQACASPTQQGMVETFDSVAPGSLPPGWVVAETNGVGAPAVWRVEREHGGACLRLVESRNHGRTYNLIFAPGVHPADLTVSVRLRADRGEEDQGGGIVWRARDADHYYVARWNPLEDNLRAYHVVDGVRTQLASADLRAGPGWHELVVTMQGTSIRVAFDGEERLRLEDSTLAGPGKVGLWTKADAMTSFDDLRIE